MALTKEQFAELYSKGLSVDQIVSFEAGQTPQTMQQSQPQQSSALFPASSSDNPLQAGLKAAGNLIPSAYNFGKNIVNAVVNPIDTAKGVGKVAIGAAQKLIPGEQGQEENFDAVIDFYKQRYGSLSAAQKTATEDPFGFGADVLGLVTGAAGVLGKSKVLSEVGSLNKLSPALKNVVQKSTFKLTPAQKINLGENVNNASRWLTENNIVGSAGSRLSKTERMLDSYESTIQGVLTKEAKDVMIPRQSIIDDLEGLKNSPEFQDDRSVDLIQNQIDGAINRVRLFPDQIPAVRLNNFKRSTFKEAYNKAGNKVSDAIEFAIADKAYERLIQALSNSRVTFKGKTLDAFNADYKSAINAKKILELAKNRKTVGIIGRLTANGLGAFLGSLVNQPVGSVIGGTVGQYAAEGLGSVGNILKSTAAAKGRIPGPAVIPAAGLNAVQSAEQDYLNQLGL